MEGLVMFLNLTRYCLLEKTVCFWTKKGKKSACKQEEVHLDKSHQAKWHEGHDISVQLVLIDIICKLQSAIQLVVVALVMVLHLIIIG